MNTIKPLRLLLMLVPALALGGFLAAAGISPLTGEEIHGNLTVKLVKTFSLSYSINPTGVAWSPDSKILGVTSLYGTKLNTYDKDGHKLSEFTSKGNNGAYDNSFAFLKGTSQVLFPIEGTEKQEAAIDIRDVATGTILKTLMRTIDDVYRPNGTSIIAVSPDQQRFAIANGAAPEAIIYSTEDNTDWHELSFNKGPVIYADKGRRYWFSDTSLCFFPDGKWLAIGKSDGHFAVVESTTGKTLKEYSTYNAPGVDIDITGLAVSPKGNFILTGFGTGSIFYTATTKAVAWDQSDHSVVNIWRVSDGRQIAGFRDTNKLVRQAAWDPKGRFVAFIDNDTLFIWQFEALGENYIRVKLPGLSTSLAVSPDGRLLAVAGGHEAIVYTIEDK